MGLIHIALASMCLALGAAVLLRRKGGREHRRFGRQFAALLLVSNVAALAVYRDSTGFGPFHALAVVSLLTLGGALFAIRLRERFPEAGIVVHAQLMCWTYVGVVCAGVSQLCTAWLGPGRLSVVVPSLVVVVVAAMVIPGGVQRAARRLAMARKGFGA